MRTKIYDNQVMVWLNADETDTWGRKWPCSGFRGERVFAAFDSNGIYDMTVNGKETYDRDDIDGNAFSCCIADHLRHKLNENHPVYEVAVGQFIEE